MVKLQINGETHEVEAAENAQLLGVLRDLLEFKGTKFGCGVGLCGACTVLVDGEQARSCKLRVDEVTGKEVTTIEGLSENGEPNTLQQAFIDQNAAQCGYCIPGMVMSAESLLRENPAPDRSEIIEALNVNLCRCGTHQRIIRAVQQASEQTTTEEK